MTLLHSALFDAIGLTVLHSLWEGAAVAILLALALCLLRGASLRYVAGCSALAAFFAMFIITFAHYAPVYSGEQVVAVNRRYFDSTQAGSLLSFRPRQLASDSLPGWVAVAWLAGVIALQVRAAGGWLLVRRMRRSRLTQVEGSMEQRLVLLRQRVRVSRPVVVFESAMATAPVVVGCLRPMILMPASLVTGMPAEQLDSILLHELAHVRRHDYLVNLVQTFVETLLFYHPATWWMSHVIRAERENNCDDVVVECTGDPFGYAEALAQLAERQIAPQPLALAAGSGDVAKRIRRILEPSRQPQTAPAVGFTAVFTLLALGACLSGFPSNAQVAAQPEGPFTQWLNQEVVYIILPEERAAFLQLQTDDERSHFIDQFWLRRDPTPNTIENEFKEEHDRRIGFSNGHFGTKTLPGWKVDRGRAYIMWGPPDAIDSHLSSACSASTPSYEDWTYRFIEGIGTNLTFRFADTACDGTFEQVNQAPVAERRSLPAQARSSTNALVKAAPARSQEPNNLEKERRVDYANRHFGTAEMAGTDSSRGRTYIRWGRPNEIDSHPFATCSANQAPFEDWRYRFVEGFGIENLQKDMTFRFVDTGCDGSFQQVTNLEQTSVVPPAGR